MKIKTNRMILILTGLLCFTSLNAQTPEPLDFFPAHVGDTWQYQLLGGSSIYTFSISGDSLDSLGNRYLNFKGTLPMLIDTLNDVYRIFPDSTRQIVYDLDADIGDVFGGEIGGFDRWGWVDAIDTTWFWGESRIVKTYKYLDVHPDSTEGYWQIIKLASGIGKIYQEREEIFNLIGAVIDGDTLGFITGIELNQPSLPRKIYLSQNFPNPFNSSTTFSMDLPEDTEIELTLINLLGQVMKRIDRGRKSGGNYIYTLDASGFATGIYIIRLRAGQQIKKQKILLTK